MTLMDDASTSLQRLVYCSRNMIMGSEAQILSAVEDILRSARRQNKAAGITGVLLFNSGCFAQVLEGPLENVQNIFEAIQRDLRHSDVVVLEYESTRERQFGNWSMGFLGQREAHRRLFDGLFSGADCSRVESRAENVLAMLRKLAIEQEMNSV